MDWKDGKLTALKIFSGAGGNCKILLQNNVTIFTLTALKKIKTMEQESVYSFDTKKDGVYNFTFK